MTNFYKEISPISKKKANISFLSNDKEAIANALVSVSLHESDWRWAQNKCLFFLSNSDDDIRGLAATCLGHIARVHKRLDKVKVINELKKRLIDEKIKGNVEDALQDIEIFLP